jgi:predicted phage terminase large subunit-like protein
MSRIWFTNWPHVFSTSSRNNHPKFALNSELSFSILTANTNEAVVETPPSLPLEFGRDDLDQLPCVHNQRLPMLRRITQHCVEQAMHGLAALQDLQREESIVNITLKGVAVDADKLTRALPFAARAEQCKVKLVAGSWVNSCLDELCFFPNGKHDDQVDTLSGGLAMLAQKRKPRVVYAF